MSKVLQIWPIFQLNCLFYDPSMAFGTHIWYAQMKIFGYRAIVVLSRNSDGDHFPKWATPLTIIANVSGSKPPRNYDFGG